MPSRKINRTSIAKITKDETKERVVPFPVIEPEYKVRTVPVTLIEDSKDGPKKRIVPCEITEGISFANNRAMLRAMKKIAKGSKRKQ